MNIITCQALHTAAKAVEQWWLTDPEASKNGAPACIFMLREALAAHLVSVDDCDMLASRSAEG